MSSDDLDIEFLEGPCPMQGWGTVRGKQFYFRSRWDRWSFAVSESPDLDPVDIYCAAQGFFIEEEYGTSPYDAGYMPKDEAEAIIQRCAQAYLAEKASLSILEATPDNY